MEPPVSPESQAMAAAVHPQAAALAYRNALARLDELDSCDLLLPDGDTVAVVTVPEVRQWMEGLVARSRAGERL